MAERQTLADLARFRPAGALPAEAEAQPQEPKVDALGRAYATARRKDAVARVWRKRGSGKFMIKRGAGRSDKVRKSLLEAKADGKTAKREEYRNLQQYFARSTLQMIVLQPFATVGRLGQYDVTITVSGGGLSGQAGAGRPRGSRAAGHYHPRPRPPPHARRLLPPRPPAGGRQKNSQPN